MQHVAIGELRVGRLGLLERNAVHRGRLCTAHVQRQVRRVQVHRHVPLAQHAGDAADVIEVRVRQPDRVERRARRAHHRDQSLRLVARIDQHGALRRLVDHEIRVLLERADRPRLDLHAV